MSNDWTIYVIIGAAFMVLARLDRLGKQLEAVNADIKAELRRTNYACAKFSANGGKLNKKPLRRHSSFGFFGILSRPGGRLDHHASLNSRRRARQRPSLARRGAS